MGVRNSLFSSLRLGLYCCSSSLQVNLLRKEPCTSAVESIFLFLQPACRRKTGHHSIIVLTCQTCTAVFCCMGLHLDHWPWVEKLGGLLSSKTSNRTWNISLVCSWGHETYNCALHGIQLSCMSYLWECRERWRGKCLRMMFHLGSKDVGCCSHHARHCICSSKN